MTDFRKIGFSDNALKYPRDSMALSMFAAFQNVTVDQLPSGFEYFPNEYTQAAWNRVAEAAYEYMKKEADNEVSAANDTKR